MSKATKFKEAIKTGLAFAMVFGIAMQLGWMNPYWAGWSVAVIALPTAGEAIRKGTLRVVGTIPGCIAALVIHALAPQERWTFMLLTCAWVFVTSYLMVSRTRDSYLWVMACYVCLVILLSDLDSSENMFESAVFRTVETVMGVVVYTLISVFIWPRTNLGALKRAGTDLATALNELFIAGRDRMLRTPVVEANAQGSQARVLQQLTRFTQALHAEGSESYEVSEVRHLWERFQTLSKAFVETTARWQSGLAELERIDARTVFPGLPAFFAELDARLAHLPQAVAGQPTGFQPGAVHLNADSTVLRRLASFDRAAVEVTRRELEKLDSLTTALIRCAGELQGQVASDSHVPPAATPDVRTRGTWLPVPDWDHLCSAAFVAATTGVGFLIWILFDPPGHSGWFQLSGTIALIVALCPQIRASRMILPVAVTSAICLAIYVLVMPQLSSFLGLGALLFTCMFLNCYFLVGMARFFSSMAILNILQIQNHQVYSFAAMANVFLFLVMAFVFLHVMSYLLGSPRPEKVVVRLLGRFFRSAEFLISRQVPTSGLERWRFAFHEQQLRAVSGKLAAWGKVVNDKLLLKDAGRMQSLVSSVQTLVHRIDQFLDGGPARSTELLTQDLRQDLHTWHAALESLFSRWSQNPEAEPVGALRQRLNEGFLRMEHRVAEAVNRSGALLPREEAEHFLRLLGGYRGVSEATVAYAAVAQTINWAHWREERFS